MLSMMNVDLMRIDDVARMMGYKVSTVYKLVYRQMIPHIKLTPKTLRFDRAEIERWIESHRKGASPEAPHVADVSKEGGQGK